MLTVLKDGPPPQNPLVPKGASTGIGRWRCADG